MTLLGRLDVERYCLQEPLSLEICRSEILISDWRLLTGNDLSHVYVLPTALAG